MTTTMAYFTDNLDQYQIQEIFSLLQKLIAIPKDSQLLFFRSEKGALAELFLYHYFYVAIEE